MRMAKVPIDMASEQKNMMGVVSTRQLIYVVVGGSIVYGYIEPLAVLLSSMFGYVLTIAVCIFAALPVVAIVAYFGFLKVSKYNMFRDYYTFIKFQRGTQIGKWRKGK